MEGDKGAIAPSSAFKVIAVRLLIHSLYVSYSLKRHQHTVNGRAQMVSFYREEFPSSTSSGNTAFPHILLKAKDTLTKKAFQGQSHPLEGGFLNLTGFTVRWAPPWRATRGGIRGSVAPCQLKGRCPLPRKMVCIQTAIGFDSIWR